MIIFTRFINIIAVFSLLSLVTVNAQNITYNVIASPFSSGQSLVVVVDNTTWPLTVTSGILYQGEAPVAKTGYHYEILERNKQPNATEGFDRAPVQNNTMNEFFNRSWNIYPVLSLPQVLTSLPIINRINTELHIQGQIPSIHIWGNASMIDYLYANQIEDIDVELNFTYFGLNDIQTFENVKVSLAGRSSRWIPKLSYGLKIKQKSDQTLFGYKNFKLRALGLDPSYIREYVAYSTIKSAGLPTTGFSYVRLFINSQAVGFYGLIETFQDPWLANEFASGDKEYQSGYLYQGITMKMNQTIPVISNLGYYNNLSYYSAGEYKIKAGSSKNLDACYLDLQEFTKFVANADSSTSVSEWNSRLNSEGFIRSMALENLLGFSDAYMTLADNYYLYSNPKSQGQMVFISSDLDTTLGISLYNMSMMTSGNFSEHPGFTFQPLTKKFFSSEAFSISYQHMLLNLTQNLINPERMNPFIDSLVDMIRPDVEWDATLTRLGTFLMPPLLGNGTTSNISAGGEAAELLRLFPPGLRLKWSDVTQTFDSAVNGPSGSTTMLSVKGFILRKSTAIMDFYNRPTAF